MNAKETKDFLMIVLRDKKMKLERLRVEHQIDLAVYNAKREMLTSDIDSLERKFSK